MSVPAKKVMVKMGSNIIKVPYSALAVTVRNPDENRVIRLKHSIIEQKKVGDTVNVVAAFPNIEMDITLGNINLEDTGMGLADAPQRVVARLYLRKFGRLKVRSRAGFHLRIVYHIPSKSILANKVRLRSAEGGKHVLLPNLYSNDGHICWGQDRLPEFTSYDDMAAGLFQVFMTAPFNADLSNKELIKSEFISYINWCRNRVGSLNDWTDSEKRDVMVWLDAVLTVIRERGTLTITVNCYTVLLMSSIFNDDLGYLSGKLVKNTVSF